MTAALTAFYTFRAYFLTFWGPEHIPHEAGHHAHESPPIMTIPLVILAIGAVLAGIAVGNPCAHTRYPKPTSTCTGFIRHWAFSGLPVFCPGKGA